MEPQPSRHYSRPIDRSLEAYKAWIRSMVTALGGQDDDMTDAEWEAAWREFWSLWAAAIMERFPRYREELLQRMARYFKHVEHCLANS